MASLALPSHQARIATNWPQATSPLPQESSDVTRLEVLKELNQKNVSPSNVTSLQKSEIHDHEAQSLTPAHDERKAGRDEWLIMIVLLVILALVSIDNTILVSVLPVQRSHWGALRFELTLNRT